MIFFAYKKGAVPFFYIWPLHRIRQLPSLGGLLGAIEGDSTTTSAWYRACVQPASSWRRSHRQVLDCRTRGCANSHPAPAWCMPCECCAHTARQLHRCTTYSAQQSFLASSRECVRLSIVCNLTHCCVAVNCHRSIQLCWRWLLFTCQNLPRSCTSAIPSWLEGHRFRVRSQNMTLMNKTTFLEDSDFIIRRPMFYKSSF